MNDVTSAEIPESSLIPECYTIIKITFFSSVAFINLRKLQKQHLSHYACFFPVLWYDWLSSFVPPLRTASFGASGGWWQMTVLCFFLFYRGRLSLRPLWWLLSFCRATGNHVCDTLAEMAPFGLRRQLAFFGMMVQTTAIVTPAKQRHAWRKTKIELITYSENKIIICFFCHIGKQLFIFQGKTTRKYC